MARYANRIREFREQKGYKAEELAQIVGTTQASISRLEQGRQALTVEWLYRLAPVLGVRPADLLDRDDSIRYAYVKGDARKKLPEHWEFSPDRVYTIPIPTAYSHFAGEPLDAFETDEQDWLIARLVPFHNVRMPGTPVIVEMAKFESAGELSVRKSEMTSQGMVYTTDAGDPRDRWVLFTDHRIKTLWQIVAEWRLLGPDEGAFSKVRHVAARSD